MNFRFLLSCLMIFGTVNCAPPRLDSEGVDRNVESANMVIPPGAQIETLNLSNTSNIEKDGQIQTRAGSAITLSFSVMCGQNLSQCLSNPSSQFCYNLTNYANQSSIAIMTNDGIAAVTCQITVTSLTYLSTTYTPSSPLTLTTPSITCPSSNTAYTNGSNTLYSSCSFSDPTIKFTNGDNIVNVAATQQTVTTSTVALTKTMLAQPVVASLNLITAGSTNYNVNGTAPAALFTRYSVMFPYNQAETYNDCRVLKLSSVSPITFYNGSSMPTTLTAANALFLNSSGDMNTADGTNIITCTGLINTTNAWGSSNASTPIYRTGDYMVVFTQYNTTSTNKLIRSYRYFVIKSNFAP